MEYAGRIFCGFCLRRGLGAQGDASRVKDLLTIVSNQLASKRSTMRFVYGRLAGLGHVFHFTARCTLSWRPIRAENG